MCVRDIVCLIEKIYLHFKIVKLNTTIKYDTNTLHKYAPPTIQTVSPPASKKSSSVNVATTTSATAVKEDDNNRLTVKKFTVFDRLSKPKQVTRCVTKKSEVIIYAYIYTHLGHKMGLNILFISDLI